jgi:DeoR/GlpR family transcriptional regulator of sugar metabolism
LTSQDRRSAIVRHLHEVESASIDGLAEMFGVSKMTVHRDLDHLEEQRIVRKSRGGATLLPSTVFEADFTYRSKLAIDEKHAIAATVADQVERGSAIFIDDSSTAAVIVPMVLSKRPLTIITNGVSVIGDVSRIEGVTLLSLGGTYDPVCNAFFGSLAERSIARLRVDLALLSAAAIRGTSAYFHNPEVARLKLACLDVADRSILMVDHSKFEKSALHLFTHLGVFDNVVTTDLLAPEIATSLRKDGVKLTVLPHGGAADKPADKRAGSHERIPQGGSAFDDGKEGHQRA